MRLPQLLTLLRSQAASGIVLLLTTLTALVISNSPLSASYQHLLHYQLTLGISPFALTYPLEHWVNDGLMTLFFFLVGLEIKRELLAGGLRSWHQRILPGAAALGGMLFPALIFVFINRNSPETLHGWAIPCATDIAFALGILALLGNRVPVSLKVFLTALAILDDLGAVLIIAFFYTQNLSVTALVCALLPLTLLYILNRKNSQQTALYIILGLILWLCILLSGVHATISGVLLALFIPLEHKVEGQTPLLEKLELKLHNWVAFLIMPVFAFFNAGLNFSEIDFKMIYDPIPLGILTGLVIGKQFGVFSTSALLIKLGYARLPLKASFAQLYGVSLLCGIGFTMSLFIGVLAYPEKIYVSETMLGVMAGSLVSAVLGLGVLLVVSKWNDTEALNNTR